jgi:putative spermidine/putrescine transport system ATP-binding protein
LSAFLDVAAPKAFGAATRARRRRPRRRAGEFVSLLGPSGCGKTTLLRIDRRAAAPDQGASRSTARDITRLPPHKRDVGVVFQNYALFPHLNVAENVAFGLKARGAPRARSRRRSALPRPRAHGGLRRPLGARRCRAASSSASRWRARWRSKPKLLLLDEPFSALDRKLRETMQIELKRLLRELGTTAIFVTHDQDEALMMSDRIAVMNRGRIEQLADPARSTAGDAFALEFVGLSTRIPARWWSRPAGEVAVDTPCGRCARPAASCRQPGPRRRPAGAHGLRRGGENTIEARLTDVVFQGARVQAHFDSPRTCRSRSRASPGFPRAWRRRALRAVLARRGHAGLSDAGRAA